MVDKFTFIPNIEDVDRMDITARGASHALIITRITKKAAKAGDPDEVDATYTADGKTVEETNFKKFYQVRHRPAGRRRSARRRSRTSPES